MTFESALGRVILSHVFGSLPRFYKTADEALAKGLASSSSVEVDSPITW